MRLKLQPKWFILIKLSLVLQILQQLGENYKLDLVKRCFSKCTNLGFLSLSAFTLSNFLKLSMAIHYKTGTWLILLNCLRLTAPTSDLSIWTKKKEDSGVRSVKHLSSFPARKSSLMQ